MVPGPRLFRCFSAEYPAFGFCGPNRSVSALGLSPGQAYENWKAVREMAVISGKIAR